MSRMKVYGREVAQVTARTVRVRVTRAFYMRRGRKVARRVMDTRVAHNVLRLRQQKRGQVQRISEMWQRRCQ